MMGKLRDLFDKKLDYEVDGQWHDWLYDMLDAIVERLEPADTQRNVIEIEAYQQVCAERDKLRAQLAELTAARDAADAAWDAVDAAWDAERARQYARLCQYLNGEA
jgi:hypothetical protein